MDLTGIKSMLLSRGVVGAVAKVIAVVAGMAGGAIQETDVETILMLIIPIITGLTLGWERITQTTSGMSKIGWASAIVSTLVGAYIAITGDAEGGAVLSEQVMGFIIALGSIVSGLGIAKAEKKVSATGK